LELLPIKRAQGPRVNALVPAVVSSETIASKQIEQTSNSTIGAAAGRIGREIGVARHEHPYRRGLGGNSGDPDRGRARLRHSRPDQRDR
jgi:hypothetical protein